MLLLLINLVYCHTLISRRHLQKSEEIDSHIQLNIGIDYEFEGKVPTSSKNVLYPTHFYKFQITQIVKSDLFVILRAKQDKSSYPSLYISSSNKFPSEDDGDDCGNDGLDVCSLDQDILELNQTYYLGVYCLKNCRFTLKIHYSEELDINLGDNQMIQFQNNTERLMKITLPAQMEEFDRIIIRGHLVYDKTKQFNETFHFYINEGNTNPTPTHYDYIADEVWTMGKGVVIHKNDTNLKANSNLTILFMSFPESRIYLISQYYYEIRQIRLFEVIDDLVGPKETNTYHLVVESKYIDLLDNNSLSIDIHPYEGNPDIYISPPPMPINLSDYKWQSQLDQGFESITISPRNRDQFCDDYEFYISVNSPLEFGSYSFYVYISNYLSRILMPLSTESGFLMKGEILEYQVFIEEYISNHYTIQATYPIGSAYLILKKCLKNTTEVQQANNAFQYIEHADPDNYYNCSITDEQLSISGTIQSGSATITRDPDTIRFYYNETECYENVVALQYETYPSNCQYVVAVVSGDTDNNIKYTLSIKGNEMHHLLFESQTTRSTLLEYDSDFYLFHNNDDADVQRIVFQLNVINGDIQVYVSRTVILPDQDHFDKYANQEMDSITFDSDLKGDYYIHVKSFSLTRYTITAIVIRNKDGVSQSQSVTLIEGQTYKHEQTDIEEISQFQFQVDFGQPEPIFIHLNALIGEFIAYVAVSAGIDAQMPSEDHFQYKLLSDYRTLIIDPEDEQYHQQGTYKIAVESISLSTNEIFQISYTTQNSLIELKYGEPFYVALDDEYTSYFVFQSTYELDQLFIIKSLITQQDEQNSINIYVSLSNKYPSAMNFTKKLENNYLTLDNLTLNQNIYIGIQSIGYNEFTLLIRGVQAITQLSDNIIQHIPMPSHQLYQQAHLYFQIRQSHLIKVQAYTKYDELLILANIVEYNQGIQMIHNNNRTLFPTTKDYMIKEKDTSTITSKFLMITKNYTNICDTYTRGCLLLLTIKINQDSISSTVFGETHDNITQVSNVLGEDGYFSIEVSYDLATIQNGGAIIGYAGDNLFSYYLFNVPSSVAMIQIMVRPLSEGDPDIYIKKQNTSNQEEVYPTVEQYDYRSVSYSADVLVLERIQGEDNSGNYIIGIIGFQEDVTFELSLNLADIQLLTILPNQQLKNLHLDVGNLYLRYHHPKHESFRILIQGINFINLAVNTQGNYQDQKGFLDQLPFFGDKQQNYKYQLFHNNNLFGGILQINANDSNFCSFCTYLIGIKPLNSTDISILVALNNQPLEIEGGIMYYDQVTSMGNHYHIKNQGKIIISKYSGDLKVYCNINSKPTQSISEIVYGIDVFYIDVITQMYFLIQSNDTAFYTIHYSSPTQLISLQLGKIFNGNVSAEFTFDLTNFNIYTLQINHLQDIQIIMTSETKATTNMAIIDPIDTNIQPNQIEYVYNLTDKNAQYTINVITNDSYSILISVQGLKYIQPNNRQFEIARNSHSQNYELFGRKGEQLQIELINCIGKSQLTSNQIQNNQIYDFKLDGDVFFSIEPIETVRYKSKESRTVFNIITHLYQKHEIWTFQNVNIQYTFNQTDVAYTFYPMKTSNQTQLKPDLMIYTLHISNEQDNLMAFAGCAMDIQSIKDYHFTNQNVKKLYHSKETYIINQITDQITIQFSKPEHEIIYSLLTFQVYYYDKDPPYTYFYPINTLQFNDTNKTEPQKNSSEQQSIPLSNNKNKYIDYIEKNLLVIIPICAALTLLILTFVIRFCILKCRQRTAKNKRKNNVEEQDEEIDKVVNQQSDP